MIDISSRWLRRMAGVPEHLQALSDHFRHLATRVRTAVAEAVGETVARAVSGLVHRGFQGKPLIERRSSEPDDWQATNDPWQHDEPYWTADDDPPEEPESTSPMTSNLWALALQGAGWWLQQRGSWLGVMGIAMFFGGAAAVGGRVALAGLSLAETVREVLSLQRALTGTASWLEH